MPSTVIQTMRFDPVRKILEVVFRGARGAYRYFGVPLEEWQRFRNAPSKGAYLNQFFKSRRYLYEKIESPAFALSFTANHAHLVPEGVAGFLDALPIDRVAEVRLADCFRNGKEEHLLPGQGDFDFPGLFRALEARGYQGHYTNAFGSLDDMLSARTNFITMS